MTPIPVEFAVRKRYTIGAGRLEEGLTRPVEYDPQLLQALPAEVVALDYGCGDPSQYLQAGETVLDLGCGGGKQCFLAAQIVGSSGKVVGIDMTGEMISRARQSAPVVADRLGYANVEFRKGRMQDLALDLEALDAELLAHPISSTDAFLAAESLAASLRVKRLLVASDSIDAVISNCALNLVEPLSKRTAFHEMFRVLKKGGRAIISDLVSDEEIPAEMQEDPELWSGCVSGAMTEWGFLEAFAEAGFYGIRILHREEQPWRIVQGIEFRALTIEAFKGKQGPCYERNQAVIYRGPFKEVLDDDGHRM